MASRLLLRPWPFTWLLALRYLKSTRRDAFASFLAAVAGLGIALGVGALIVSLAMISGFQEALRGELLSRTPEILIDLPPGADAEASRAAVAGVSGIRSARLEVRGSGWIVDGGKVQPVELIGFEGPVPAFFPGAAGKAPGLYLPEGLSTRWGLRPGEVLDVVSPKPTLAPFGGPVPRVRSLPLSGTYASGKTQEERERVALPRDVAESLLGSANRKIEVAAGGLDAALAAAPGLAAALAPVAPGSVVRTWADLNRPLLFALRLEKTLTFVAVFLIVLVATLALVASLSLVIASKRAEIGMLGAMGATGKTLERAFRTLGGLIAGIGLLLGASGSVATCWVLDHYKLVPVPGRVYFLEYVPFLVQGRDLAWVLLLTFGLALAASTWAARRAAALDPLEAIRR
ncbi:MAG TPA: FtsX-like permease family protein [Thermoanaerobaculia bacterium]|nr:FtsX-like permease family protein [Thermoanaerobaculia bacterium]